MNSEIVNFDYNIIADVHGKVIHLVQRAPPSSNNETTNSGSEGRTNTAPRRGPFRTIIAPGGRMDGASGNAMYLGAMAFPADLMDAQGTFFVYFIDFCFIGMVLI